MIGLHAAELVPFGAYGIIDYIMATSSTPQEALEKAARYFQLVTDAFQLVFSRRKQELRLEVVGDARGMPRQYIEYVLASLVLRMRRIAGVCCPSSEVHFAHRAPAQTSEFYRILRAPVTFGQRVNRVTLNCDEVSMIQPEADPPLCRVLCQRARDLTEQMNRARLFQQNLSVSLQVALRCGDMSLKQAARSIAVSTRSLQRRLQQSGTSFRAVVDQVRCEHAVMLLRGRHVDADELVGLLRFAEPSSFYRAFKRWTGTTPGSYLRRHA